jgi:hypothetical protein
MPFVVTSPVRAPRRSMIAFVAIVEPCLKPVTSAGSMPALSRALITPSMNPGGVDGVLTLVSSCVSSSYATRSVNVPPMSTATLSFLTRVLLPVR